MPKCVCSGVPPRTCWGSLQCFPDLAGFKGLLLGDGEGMGEEGSRRGEEKERGGKGKEGWERGKGNTGTSFPPLQAVMDV